MSDQKSPADPPMEEILATVRRIIAEDEAGTSPPAVRAAPAAGGDVLELTEVLEPDGSIRHIPPFGAALRGPSDKREPPLGDGRIEPAAPNLGNAARKSAGPSLGPAETGAEREPLTARPTVAPMAPPEVMTHETGAGADRSQVGGGNQGLDNLLREMLRPMLQRWLDENLPAMVEEAVRAEVARTSADIAAEIARGSSDAAAPRRAARGRAKARPDEA